MNYAAFRVAAKYYDLQPAELEHTYFLYNFDEDHPGMTMYAESEGKDDPETVRILNGELEDGLQTILAERKAEREQQKFKAKVLTFLHVI